MNTLQLTILVLLFGCAEPLPSALPPPQRPPQTWASQVRHGAVRGLLVRPNGPGPAPTGPPQLLVRPALDAAAQAEAEALCAEARAVLVITPDIDAAAARRYLDGLAAAPPPGRAAPEAPAP